jgi:hypothetical protein
MPENNTEPELMVTFEVREVSGPEGELLTQIQARALRRALAWALEHDEQSSEQPDADVSSK